MVSSPSQERARRKYYDAYCHYYYSLNVDLKVNIQAPRWVLYSLAHVAMHVLSGLALASRGLLLPVVEHLITCTMPFV